MYGNINAAENEFLNAKDIFLLINSEIESPQATVDVSCLDILLKLKRKKKK